MPVEDSIDFENDLPAELQVLARQLGADAASLSAQYPGTPEQRRLTSIEVALDHGTDMADAERSFGAWGGFVGVAGRAQAADDDANGVAVRAMPWLTAAGTCAAAIFLAIASWSSQVHDGRDRSTAVRHPKAPSTVAPHDVVQGADKHSEQTQAATPGATHSTAHNVLEGLSGAEQEAVLDLLENRSEQEGSLSI
jgi:hypothetical protein